MDDLLSVDLLRVAARRWPQRVAIRIGDEAWTYSDLNYAADEIGARVPFDERVAFRAYPSIATVAAIWGIPRRGGVALPLEPDLGPAEAASAAAALGALLGTPDPSGVRSPPIVFGPDSASYIVQTSGSSGSPRGVMLTRGNVAAASAASQRHLGTSSSDVWLLALPLHHIAGLAILWRAAHDGALVEIHEGFVVDRFARSLGDGATWTSLVPTMLRRLLNHGGRWPDVHGALVGGARVEPSLIEAAHEAGLAALPTYGMTETTAQVATVRPMEIAAASGSVGFPLPGVTVTIDAAPGRSGPIRVDGPTVSPGYVGEPPRAGPLDTNDIGYFDESGRLVVVGRADGVIITGGENVHPGRVEDVINSVSGVAACAVVGLPDADWGERVVAAVIVTEDADSILDRLAAECRSRLPAHSRPKQFSLVDELPLLANGKVDRRRLVEGLSRGNG